MFPALILAQIR